MKNIKLILSAVVLTALVSSCTVTAPYAVSDNPIGSKTGKSTTTVFLGIQFNSNHGVQEAAKKGKIRGGISTVDLQTTSYILFSKRTLIVTGE